MKKVTNYKIQCSFAIGMMEYWNTGILYLEDCKNAILNKGASPLVPSKSSTTKGSHGLHQDYFKLQTMTALIKSFCGGVQGGQFFQKAPPLAQEA